MNLQQLAKFVSSALVIVLAACGGGSNSVNTGGGSVGALSGADGGAMSTGSITAFGSVFVNGHEFSTTHARVVDDDSGGSTTSASGLEVGMVVDVVAAAGSSSAVPVASELHLHPLARGYVDGSDIGAGMLTVMGQNIAVTATTLFSDHRACVSAASSPCSAITDQSGLTATVGSGVSAVAGSYVTVHGYLFASGSSATHIVATLVSVADLPTSTTSGVRFKAEGVLTASGGTAVTIGGLNVDLSNANCYAAGAKASCAGSFNAGQVVSVIAAAAPSLPAVNLAADSARLRSRIVVATAGASVEIEGSVSSVTSSPAAFVVRGISVDATALPAGSSLPAVGDIVTVLGTVSATGLSLTASGVKVLHASRSAVVGLLGDATGVSSGSAADTYVVSILGQRVTVTATTRLADRSTKEWYFLDPVTNPFNIGTFQLYLAASASQHLIVRAEADASGNLAASSLTIVPASTTAGVAGIVDASPAPMNSSTAGTMSTFSVHSIAIEADPTSVLLQHGSTATVAAGDEVVAYGSFSAAKLTVTAGPTRSNVVLDFGPQRRHHLDGF